MKLKKHFKPILAFLIILGVFAGVSLWLSHPVWADWVDDSWMYRQKITFNNSGTAVTNQKVKFDINTAALITGGKMQADCGDSRFTTIGGNFLRYYIDTAGGACNTDSTDYYVLMPAINIGNNVIYHYYGNPSAVNGTENAQFSESTFTPNGTPTQATPEAAPSPAGNWKFDEASGTAANDSSSNANNADLTASTAVWKTSDYCMSGACLYYDGTGAFAKVTNATSIELDKGLASGFTFSTWIRANGNGTVFTKGTNTYLKVTNSGSDGLADLEAKVDLATTDATITVVNGLSLNNWHHLRLQKNSKIQKIKTAR